MLLTFLPFTLLGIEGILPSLGATTGLADAFAGDTSSAGSTVR